MKAGYVPFKVKCPIRIIIFGIFTALFLKLNLNTKYRFACSIWSNNQCQWLLEFYDTRFTVGITADSLNLHLFQRRHVLPNLTKILSKIKKKLKLLFNIHFGLSIPHHLQVIINPADALLISFSTYNICVATARVLFSSERRGCTLHRSHSTKPQEYPQPCPYTSSDFRDVARSHLV